MGQKVLCTYYKFIKKVIVLVFQKISSLTIQKSFQYENDAKSLI